MKKNDNNKGRVIYDDFLILNRIYSVSGESLFIVYANMDNPYFVWNVFLMDDNIITSEKIEVLTNVSFLISKSNSFFKIKIYQQKKENGEIKIKIVSI